MSEICPTCDYFAAPTPLILDTKTGQRITFTTVSNTVIELLPERNLAHLGFGEFNEVLFVFDTQTLKLIKPVWLDKNGGPIAIATSPTTGRVYIANKDSKSISVLDAVTYTVSSTISLPSSPYDLTISPDGQFIYTILSEVDRVAVIDSKDHQVIKEIVVGSKPSEAVAMWVR